MHEEIPPPAIYFNRRPLLRGGYGTPHSRRTSQMRPRMLLLTAIILCSSLTAVCSAADPFQGADFRWQVLHTPALPDVLELPPERIRGYRELLDRYDTTFFPLRNHPSDTVGREVEETLAALMKELEGLLTRSESQRLQQLFARCQGPAVLLDSSLAATMEFSDQQRERLERLFRDGAEKKRDLEKRLQSGEPMAALRRELATAQTRERIAVQGVLTARQRDLWRRALGKDIDLTMLGDPTYKAPELIDSGDWINSEPVRLHDLKGTVVVLHFFACGCINCVHNYPVYQEWFDRFHGKGVVLIGVHTPETAFEEKSANVRQKAAEDRLPFPVLIDGERKNWNAWGNSMWPSVYLLDKWGRLRAFWPGELKWQGATGDEWILTQIDRLLAEQVSPTPGESSDATGRVRPSTAR